MEKLKKIELDENDIGIIFSLWLYIGFLMGKPTEIEGTVLSPPPLSEDMLRNFLIGCGDDCFRNLNNFFEKYHIPKAYALKCHHENMKLSGLPGMEEYSKNLEDKIMV